MIRSVNRLHLVAACLAGAVLSGCVMQEKYEAEKTRALNFQRLLAQEEKRTGEMEVELKRLKKETADLESKNKELSAQLQAVREQLARVQEEAALLREAAAQREREREEAPAPVARKQPKKSVKPDRTLTPAPEMPGLTDQPEPLLAPPPTEAARTERGAPVYHEVRPGETLFRIGRLYGVGVDKIKQWNHLSDDLIEVGQRLVVGYQ
jgi:LysM repeat protein